MQPPCLHSVFLNPECRKKAPDSFRKSHANAEIVSPADAELGCIDLGLNILGMRVLLALLHSKVQRFLGRGRVEVLVVELAGFAVDVEVPSGLCVLVNLHGADSRVAQANWLAS